MTETSVRTLTQSRRLLRELLKTAQHESSVLRIEITELSRPLIFKDPVRVIPDTVLDQGREDWHGIPSLVGETIVDPAIVRGIFHSLDYALLLKIAQAHRKHPWGQPGVLMEYLTEGDIPQKCDVAEDWEGPLAAQASEAQADRAGLVGDRGEDEFVRVLSR